jgi:pimeloyl-ACP methyl ester carboxylesterase
VGHSLGAQVALRLAADDPHLARGLVLAAPSGGPTRLLRLRQLAALGLTAVRVPPPLVLATLREYAGNNPLRVVGTWLRGAADDPTAHAARVRVPTLILAGGRDPVPGKRYMSLLRQRLPDVRYQVVPGATHALPREAPAAFTRAVAAFVHALPP